MKALLAIITIAALSGCTTIKQADIKEATFNTAGWKSQAGVGSTATIEATTVPSANLNQQK